MEHDPAIVIPAFRRNQSLKRLLRSIRSAWFDKQPRVIISIEGEASDDVVRTAESFADGAPGATVRKQVRRLGLRDHIMSCADLSLEYGSVIVLEDDLVVDRYFHHYATAALDFYSGFPEVSGIALYAPEFNEYAGMPFRPMHNGFDTYPMRVPCSWGQAWTASQWGAFRDWYQGASENSVLELDTLAPELRAWPPSSWKKFFAAFMSKTGHDFIYPYRSFSTNVSDRHGEHMPAGSRLLQVQLSHHGRPVPDYRFAPEDHLHYVAYDEFHEATCQFASEALGLGPHELSVDLYGVKPLSLLRQRKYAITIRTVRASIREFPLVFRPIEQNLCSTDTPEAGSLRLSLALSADILEERHWPSLAELSYHGGHELRSRRVAKSFAAELPRLVLDRIKTNKVRFFGCKT